MVPHLKTTGIQATRDNDLKIFKTHLKYDLCKFYFTNRVVDAWHSLPNWIVMANSTNTFKRRLDIYWQDQGPDSKKFLRDLKFFLSLA